MEDINEIIIEMKKMNKIKNDLMEFKKDFKRILFLRETDALIIKINNLIKQTIESYNNMNQKFNNEMKYISGIVYKGTILKDKEIIKELEWVKEQRFEEMNSDYCDKNILEKLDILYDYLFEQLSLEAKINYIPKFEYKDALNPNEQIPGFIYDPNINYLEENKRRKLK